MLRAICLTLRVASVAVALWAVPSRAQDFQLALPVACSMGRDCFIQNFFDDDPGPDRRDYACGRLSYDKHDGTDIRVRDYLAMADGVAVIAAAGGMVLRVRDGMPDVSIRDGGREAIKGREAGNSVIIDHGSGWETQYAHLRRGSIVVRPGDRVQKGQKLGLIGLSGHTEFPHVHFEVRHKGRSIDPFVGLGNGPGCNGARQALWSDEALQVLAYQPTGVLAAGFATGRAEADIARKGGYAEIAIDRKAPALVFWTDTCGVLQGDRQTIQIFGPDGRRLVERSTELAKSNVSWFAFSGLKAPPSGFEPGTYRGVYTLTRDGKQVGSAERQIAIP